MIDIVKKRFTRSELQLEFIYLLHKRNQIDFIRGKYSFTMNSHKNLSDTGLTDSDVTFISLGFFNAYFYCLKSHLKKEFTWETYTDSKGYRVCVTKGSYIIPILKQAGVEVDGLNTSISCMKNFFPEEMISGATSI
jgi:hypothetical protein